MAEQRTFERLRARLPIQVTIAGEVRVGATLNVSLGGALVRLDRGDPPAVGARVRASLSLPTLASPIEVDAEIRWAQDDGRFGLQFVSGLRARETWALGQWLERLRAEQGGS